MTRSPSLRFRLSAVWLFGLVAGAGAMEVQSVIDRQALVSRHDLEGGDYEIPLGNGNFAFNADGTGLETFHGNTMSHWCWHSFPLPPDIRKNDIRPWATTDHGRLSGSTTPLPPAVYQWMRRNPHPLNLGRVGFVDANGVRLQPSDVHLDSRHLTLWTGLLETKFTYLGEPVTVETCVDPKSDTVAVHVTSPLLRDGRLRVLIDFAAPAGGDSSWLGDFSSASGHRTDVVQRTSDRLELKRTIDETEYDVVLATNGEILPTEAFTTVEVSHARYGAPGGGWADVTAKVGDLLHDGAVAVSSSNALGGDPAPQLPKQLEIEYRLDGIEHRQSIPEGSAWTLDGALARHRFIVAAKRDRNTLDFTCGFGPAAAAGSMRSVDEIEARSAESWAAFWKSGGAIDLSGSKDPRWVELERRIVLSQYQLAVQSAGDNPPAEVGLTGTDPWEGKWHFEMIWWHLAHYGLWDRWAKAEKALTIYQRISPVARAIARNFDYRGLMWPKSTGPDGYNDGYPPEMALLWKQPHPIFFAELDYRLHPNAATLAKWKDIVFGTAEFMADYPTKNMVSGHYDLVPSWPASEGGINAVGHNTIFELAYWRAALEMAQQWRHRLGLKREPRWDEVAKNLAPLPEKDGLYIFSEERADTFTIRKFDHLDNIGFLGMLPPFQGLDLATGLRTVKEVARDWRWEGVWGWDFPWLAMAAARVGEPGIAIEALLNPAAKNHYDERGLCTGGPPPYLPGNGGLLYAVAMMAAGWDGAPKRHAPGFPDDGSWVVHWEGLKPAP